MCLLLGILSLQQPPKMSVVFFPILFLKVHNFRPCLHHEDCSSIRERYSMLLFLDQVNLKFD